jgi:ubiquinone/menaquinone biosynthesis C-methylase UbiE
MKQQGRREPDPFARLAPYYDALMSSVPYPRWADYVSELAALSGRLIRPGTQLLDLATGTGSVALEFAARACVVTGVDRSEPMLVEARRKAAARGLEVEFICRDLCDFQLPANFDHAVCLYDSLNYILDPDSLKRAFANCHAALKPGGLLIFDVNTVRALEAELFTQTSPEGAEVKYRWLSKYDAKSRISSIRMHFEILPAKEQFSLTHRQRAYTDAELRLLLFEAAFSDTRSYDAYRVTPPTAMSDRVFYVAHATNARG